MMPYLAGFYYGHLATGDPAWVDLLINCADAWFGRAMTEPDGFPGWPKLGAAGTTVDNLDSFNTDSLLGEAMALRFVVLMSGEILKSPGLKEKYGAKAERYLTIAEQVFEKWNARGAWRDTEGGGSISVVLPFGIDRHTGKWTSGYETRNAPGNGLSHPNNKANFVASWLLAMFNATGKSVYKERAEKWFRVMKSRMTVQSDGTYAIWNYWQPAGDWDYSLSFIPKHWIGVHSNAAYYGIDVESIVAAYENRLVFNEEDINRLVKTALAQARYWTALVPYSKEIQQRFEADHRANSWAGLMLTPWYLALQTRL